MTVDGDNNLTVTVSQADGMSKSGSVELPVPQAGEVPVEAYGTYVDTANFNKTMTFSSSKSFATTSTVNNWYFYITTASNPMSSDTLFFDKTNNLIKRGSVYSITVGSSGSAKGNKKTSSLSDSQKTWLETEFSWLVGLTLNLSYIPPFSFLPVL